MEICRRWKREEARGGIEERERRQWSSVCLTDGVSERERERERLKSAVFFFFFSLLLE